MIDISIQKNHLVLVAILSIISLSSFASESKIKTHSNLAIDKPDSKFTKTLPKSSTKTYSATATTLPSHHALSQKQHSDAINIMTAAPNKKHKYEKGKAHPQLNEPSFKLRETY